MDKLIIFDTTLRDGEQAPGASLNDKEKLEVAFQLQRLGVNVIEAGFPVSSKGDFNAVNLIARNVRSTVICGLARAMEKDIDAAFAALKPAKRPRIHVFLATSKIHMKYKFKKAEDEILRLAVKSVKYARNKFSDVQFSPEDASRTDHDFLCQVVEGVIKAGATVVNIPDTVGYSEPEEFGALIRMLKNRVPNVNKAVIAVHCHNDLGLAVANSLSAVKNGARQVECTVNGIGERAGNAAVEEIVMGIKTRRDIFPGVAVSINSREIYKTSRLVSKLTGFLVAPNKAIVGLNAFRHESGIHQDGVLKERSTYEIISPDEVGFSGSGIVLGKHSGKHALQVRLKTLGFHLKGDDLEKISEKFKLLADKKKEVFDEDLFSLVEDEIKSVSRIWQLESIEVSSGTKLTPLAKVCLRKKTEIKQAQASGDGPVDSCYKAIDKITGIKGKLLDYRLESLTSGKDAVGEVSVRIKVEGKEFCGRGSSTDIIEASVKAYVDAVNRVFGE